jgi:hypothetical protein
MSAVVPLGEQLQRLASELGEPQRLLRDRIREIDDWAALGREGSEEMRALVDRCQRALDRTGSLQTSLEALGEVLDLPGHGGQHPGARS